MDKEWNLKAKRMNLYNQIKYNGYHINIYYDDDAGSPRKMFDNLGTLYTAHRRYRPEKEFDEHFDIDKVFDGRIGNFRGSFLKEYIALPVYLYEHSGTTVSTSPFSLPVGFRIFRHHRGTVGQGASGIRVEEHHRGTQEADRGIPAR